MTHVSKRKLEPRLEKRITNAFMDALFSTSLTRGKARVRSILTQTEKLMLAKRLAIIVMLNRNESYYQIEKTLNVSGSSVKRLHGRLLAGEFDSLCRVFSRNLSFVDYLEIFLAAGMPSRSPRHQKRLDILRSGRNPRRQLPNK